MNTNLKENVSLEVIYDGKTIFQSHKHWLHPLFDFIDYLNDNPVNMKRAEVKDKIVGLAAALLILRLGAGRVRGELMSELAINVLEGAGIPYSFNKSIKKIACDTEILLQGVEDPEVAYNILCKRANRC